MNTANNNTSVKATVKALWNVTLGCLKGASAIVVEAAPLVESSMYLVAGGIRVAKKELALEDIRSVDKAEEVINHWFEDEEESEDSE